MIKSFDYAPDFILMGHEDFVDILGVYHIHVIGLYLRVISMHFRVFAFGQGT